MITIAVQVRRPVASVFVGCSAARVTNSLDSSGTTLLFSSSELITSTSTRRDVMQQREVLPEEILEMFQDAFDYEFPWPADGPTGTDYEAYWTFNVAKGVGILKCSLRDVWGNEEDFEWELIRKTL